MNERSQALAESIALPTSSRAARHSPSLANDCISGDHSEERIHFSLAQAMQQSDLRRSNTSRYPATRARYVCSGERNVAQALDNSLL